MVGGSQQGTNGYLGNIVDLWEAFAKEEEMLVELGSEAVDVIARSGVRTDQLTGSVRRRTARGSMIGLRGLRSRCFQVPLDAAEVH